MNNKILQWNIRSIRSNIPQLEHLLSHIGVAIIAEIWLEPDTHYSVSGCSLTHCLRRDSYGGCGIFVRNNILYVRQPLVIENPQEKTQICGVKIYQGAQRIIILSVYSIARLCQTGKNVCYP